MSTFFDNPNALSDFNRYSSGFSDGSTAGMADWARQLRDSSKNSSITPSKASEYTDSDKWKDLGQAFRMAGDVWNKRGDGYGYGSDRAISSIGGGGVQQQGDLTFVYPQTFSPFTIAGTPGSRGFGSAIGGALGAAAAMIPGMGPGIAAALPAIGSGVGGFFG
jgi:hypothetical protein